MGFGRSGTSALTRVLSLCGAVLPAGLLGATSSNPRGYWEPRAAIHLNETILRRHGASAYDVKLCPDNAATTSAQSAASIAEIAKFLTTLPTEPVVVIKEPKMTAVSGLWFEAARLTGFDVATVIAVRHPAECIGSVEKRTHHQLYVGSSPELVSAWWLKYSLLAERETRGLPRVFVEYSNLLEDWHREVKRISTALEVDLGAQDEIAINDFLKPELRHHRHERTVLEPFGTDWIRPTYEAMSAAARDEQWDQSVLDRVFEAYRASESGFRLAFEDSRRYRNLNRLFRPTTVKVALEVLALLHRRKGTWA
ncbi:sulfotransferase family protein [Mycolicibacterium sp. S2-37]|uniref:sulfotransferase family protein n=1 Tax=Mycolicibacterium sp. S2-37 TaxID=2810297 RepID=UPI001F5F1981|nr:sulfotransferase family protein [Mycolicibacterium sp. S2-37]